MWLPSHSQRGDAAFLALAEALRRVREAPVPILVDATTAARSLGICERAFHDLRKRADFPKNATVVLSGRCVRFRLEALQTFALSLALAPQGEAIGVPQKPEAGSKRAAGSRETKDAAGHHAEAASAQRRRRG